MSLFKKKPQPPTTITQSNAQNIHWIQGQTQQTHGQNLIFQNQLANAQQQQHLANMNTAAQQQAIAISQTAMSNNIQIQQYQWCQNNWQNPVTTYPYINSGISSGIYGSQQQQASPILISDSIYEMIKEWSEEKREGFFLGLITCGNGFYIGSITSKEDALEQYKTEMNIRLKKDHNKKFNIEFNKQIFEE